MMAAGTMASPFNSRAQSNVYSLSIYAGGVSTSPVFQIGSWPKGFCIYRESYWTGPQGGVIMFMGNPRGIQPGDKHHVETKVYLRRASLSIPLPPIIVGMLATCVLLAMIAALGLIYMRRPHPARAVVPDSPDRQML